MVVDFRNVMIGFLITYNLYPSNGTLVETALLSARFWSKNGLWNGDVCPFDCLHQLFGLAVVFKSIGGQLFMTSISGFTWIYGRMSIIHCNPCFHAPGLKGPPGHVPVVIRSSVCPFFCEGQNLYVHVCTSLWAPSIASIFFYLNFMGKLF